MDFSDFGKRFAAEIGIGELMDDLGDALVADPAPLMLGGGNPAHVPEVQAVFKKRMEDILSKQGEFERAITIPVRKLGRPNFDKLRESIMFSSQTGWASVKIILGNGVP